MKGNLLRHLLFIFVYNEYIWGRGYFWFLLSIRGFFMLYRRGDHRHSKHSLKMQQPFKDKSCTKINKMAKWELRDAVSVFGAVLFMYGCRIFEGLQRGGVVEGVEITPLSTKQNFCSLSLMFSHSSLYLSVFTFYLFLSANHRTMWMWTFILLFDLRDSRVAAGAAVGCLMQQPINNQCVLRERTP